MNSEKKYDVCLSFAGEDRVYVRSVASSLKDRGVKVFYDEHNEVELWGENLAEYLPRVYRDESLLAVAFVSEHYVRKPYAVLERRAALEAALNDFDQKYLLIARFDDVEVPGFLGTVQYADCRKLSPVDLASRIESKLVAKSARLPARDLGQLTEGASQSREPRNTDEFDVRTIDENGEPVQGVNVFLVTDRGTFKNNFTDNKGVASLPLPYRELQTVYCAAVGYSGHVEPNYDPVTHLEVQLNKLPGGGSVALHNWGSIPRLGGLFIVQDSSFIAVSNLSLNGGSGRISRRSDGVFPEFELKDPDGNIAVVRVLDHQKSNVAIANYIYTN